MFPTLITMDMNVYSGVSVPGLIRLVMTVYIGLLSWFDYNGYDCLQWILSWFDYTGYDCLQWTFV